MESENTNQKEMTLIDIFYKDTDRLNSLISQFDKGTLQTLTTKDEDKQGSSYSSEAKLNAAVASGSFSLNGYGSNTRSIEQSRVLADYNIIAFLTNLGIVPTTKIISECIGRLVILKGVITLQNYPSIKDSIPLIDLFCDGMIAQDPEIITLKATINSLRNSNTKASIKREQLRQLESSLNQKLEPIRNLKTGLNILPNIIPFLPNGVGIDIKLEDESHWSGVLKTDYLTDDERILFANYQANLPGTWNILAIADSGTNTPTPAQPVSPIDSLSLMSQMLKSMLNPIPVKGTLKPILIYRELEA